MTPEPGASSLSVDSSLSVSVIVPVHDRVDFLEEAVDSALAQHHPLEVVIVDDGSTDGTAALADRLAEGDDRVRVIHQANGGAARARNVGMRAARHDLVANLDSDDVMAPDRVAQQVAFLVDHPQHAGVMSRAEHVVVPGTRPPRHVLALVGPDPATAFALSTLMVRRDLALAVGGYGEDMVIAEDTELVLRLASAGHAVGTLDHLGGQRRLHDANVSIANTTPSATLLSAMRRHIDRRRHHEPDIPRPDIP